MTNKNKLCPREELIIKIKCIFQKKLPNVQLSDSDISRLIYYNPKFIKDDFLHARKIRRNSRPDLLVLMKIVYFTQNLSTKFVSKITMLRCINSSTLDAIKKEIKQLIIDFIFDNPYRVKYIKRDNRVNHKRDIKFWKPEFELFLDLWYAASLNNNKLITIRTFQKKIGNPAFSTPTKIGKCNSKYLLKLFRRMPSLFSRLSEDDFKQVRQSVKQYVKIRKISETYKNYSIYWDDEYTKKVHITIILLRDLGIDILTLNKIPSISFNEKLHQNDQLKFQRHHIFNNKESIDQNQLVLTINKLHRNLEGCSNLIIRLLKERINWSNNNIPYFYNNLENSQSLWREFLNRRDALRIKGINYFFKTYYPDFINRFYKNINEDQLELSIKQLIKEWVCDGNPIPVLPKIVQNRLGFKCVK